MPSSTLLSVISTCSPGDIGTAVTPDTMLGGIAPAVLSANVSAGGNTTFGSIFYAAGINSFAVRSVVQTGGGRQVDLSIVPVDPITLLQYSDSLGQFHFPILLALIGTTYNTFGLDTNSAVSLMSTVFQLRVDESGGGLATACNFIFWGFAAMNRGLLVE
jgi:hypothetical protein